MAGGVWNRSKSGELFFKWLTINTVRDPDGKLTHFIAVYRDAATVKAAQSRINYLATHDELTQLHNRQLFEDRITQAISQARPRMLLGVLVLHLDGLNTVNSALGYAAGNSLLKAVAARLRDACADCLAIARMSGNQFGVLIRADTREQLSFYCDHLLHALNAPYLHHGSPVMVPVSIGISVYPQHGDRVETLLQHAHAALSRAKEQGDHRYRFFSVEMQQQLAHHYRIEHGLRQALTGQGLFVLYQPQIGTADGSVAGCEALLRWRNAEGVVSPVEFIPVAESAGMIVAITEWVLRQVCRDLRDWDQQALAVPVVSVNISARHFLMADMVPSLLGILEQEQVEPARICLEITEGVLADPVQCERKLLDLKRAGFAISVDDFGTGFSSLSYLKRFAMDELKIDRSFVNGIQRNDTDRAIVGATLSMAHSLGLRVVAEGVEEEAQVAYLRQHGCELLQGYLFSPPIAATELAAYVRERQSKLSSA